MLSKINIYLASFLVLLFSLQLVSGICYNTDYVESEYSEKTAERDGAEKEAALFETIVSSSRSISVPGKLTTGNKNANVWSVPGKALFSFAPVHHRLSCNFLSFICVFRL